MYVWDCCGRDNHKGYVLTVAFDHHLFAHGEGKSHRDALLWLYGHSSIELSPVSYGERTPCPNYCAWGSCYCLT
jgi:hypothetical protein